MQPSQPSPPPPPVGAAPWPYPPSPPPPRPSPFPTLLVVLVILAVVGIVFSAVLALLIFSLLPGGPPLEPPTVALGPISLSGGNATFEVTGVSASSPIDLFEVNLAAGGSTGSPQSIERAPAYAVVPISSERYRIVWTSVGQSSFLSAGDRFAVTGDGVPLRSGTTFAFYLIWRVGGNVVTSTTWTTSAGAGKPVITFSAVSQDGNATIGVAGASQSVSPSNYRVNLQVGTVTGTAVAMPTAGGTFVSVVVSGTTYRIYWTDIGGELTVNSGDNFRVTGNGIRLPAATSFTFHLLWSDGSAIQSVVWSTP